MIGILALSTTKENLMEALANFVCDTDGKIALSVIVGVVVLGALQVYSKQHKTLTAGGLLG